MDFFQLVDIILIAGAIVASAYSEVEFYKKNIDAGIAQQRAAIFLFLLSYMFTLVLIGLNCRA